MTPWQRLRRHLPLAVWSLAVAVLLATPGDEFPETGSWDWLDKPAHALLFAVQCALIVRSLVGSGWRGRDLAVAGLGSGLYAVVLEAVQIWVPGRSWDWWDVAADLAGIVFVALLIARRRARLRATF